MFRVNIVNKRHFYLPVCCMACILTCLPCPGYAKMKWEKIDEAELKKTSYEEAPEAEAVILFDRGRMALDYDYRQNETEVVQEAYRRIKILNEKGYDHANVRIMHRKDIDDLEARTILTNGKVIKLKKEDFHENTLKIGSSGGNLYDITFTFPALEPGCIIEYKFVKKSRNIFFLDKWYFQNRLYTFHSEFTGEISSFFAYNYYLSKELQGILKPTVNEYEFHKDGIKQANAQYTWELNNIEGIKEEPFSPPMNSYRPQMFFMLSAIRPPGSIQKIPVFDNWESVARVFYRGYGLIKDSKEVKAAAVKCTENCTDRDEKIRAVFNYLKEQYTYSGTSGADESPRPPKETMKEKRGDAADLSALMIQMLRDVEIDAYPAIITTRHDPPFLRNFPSPSQFSKMIVYVFDAETPLWINPAGSFVNYKILPWEDQGQEALVVNSEKGTFSQTSSSSPADNFVSHFNTVKINLEGFAEVSGWAAFGGLCEDIYARKLDGMNDSERKKYVKQIICPFIPDAEITSFKIPDDLRTGEKLRIDYSFKCNSSVQATADRLMVNPALCHKFSAESFESEQRTNPIFFEYPYSVIVTSKIIIPEGFKLIGAPKPINLSKPFGQFIRYFERDGEDLSYQKKYTLPEIMFTAKSYPVVRNYYHRLEALDEESLVFQEKTAPPEQ